MEKEDTAFVYTLSSRNKMVQQCLRSIATLKHFVPETQIKVFYTPPYDEEDEKALRDTGAEIIKKENQTEAFSVSLSQPERHYGEKINLCNLEEETVIFLDCDTVIGHNIWDVLEGEFDFKARPGKIQNKDKWKKAFDRFEEEYIDWMPNAGFMVFKNNTHKEIQEKWIHYLEQDLGLKGRNNMGEQYALALAVSHKETVKMSEKEHLMEWLNEKKADANVYHTDQSAGSSTVNILKNLIKRVKP